MAVAAEAVSNLRDVTLVLDGTTVGTVSFTQGQAVKNTQRTAVLRNISAGAHTLTAQATDWAGNTQTQTFPVSFMLDLQAPTVTLTTTQLQEDDSYNISSGMFRFAGTASDDVQLASVQIRAGNGVWADAILDGTTWRAAYWLGLNAYNQAFRISVRAIDFAGRTTETTRTINVMVDDPFNTPPEEAPTTTLVSGPSNPSKSADATFTFTGTTVCLTLTSYR